MFKVIISFNQVEISNNIKYLILCDIDDTILHFPDCDSFCKELIKDLHINKNFDKELKLLKSFYRRIKEPTHTDYKGFANMIQKINESNSKIMFLTARHIDCDNLTKTHLKQIGIIPSKRKYIKPY
jgi:hypothetical protein